MPKRPAPQPVRLATSQSRAVRPSQVRPSTQTRTPAQRASVGRAVGLATAAAGAAFLAINTAAASPELSSDLNSLQTSLTDVQSRGSFDRIITDINNLEKNLDHVLVLLENARKRDYVYQSDLEELAYQAADQWENVRGKVDAALQQKTNQFHSTLRGLDSQINQLNSNLNNQSRAAAHLKTTQDSVNQIEWDLRSAESALEAYYSEIESSVQKLNTRLTNIHWSLDQVAEAKFKLEKAENLVMAVLARWDKEGKDDPEGVLYLSNVRLIFEQKEKVATKKVLFITTASELVQNVLIDEKVSDIKDSKAQSKGLFGHQDFLEVNFSNPKLGTVALHLNGQDSKEWHTLIQRVRSGEIENDKFTGSGFSISDITGPLTNANLVEIQNEVSQLQDEMMLSTVKAELAEVEAALHAVERTLPALRAKGYVVEKSLEADLKVLGIQWDEIKTRTETAMNYQVGILSTQMSAIQKGLAELMGVSANLEAARPKYMALKSSIASAEAQADAAEATVLDQFDEFADEIDSMEAHLEWVQWMLDAISTASFRLLATESSVAAVEALWERPGLEPENGILYLTDQRMLWEDRVDAYELKFDVPIQSVASVKNTIDEANGAEYLEFDLDGSNLPVSKARFALSMPVSDGWVKMVGRAKAGGYIEDRSVEVDETELERIRNAPKQCSNCGATFTAPVLRGQTEIVCEYCAVVERI